MRIGQNPAKFVNNVAQPADITVSVVNCIPFLSGFYHQSLDVLKACLNSIHENTDHSFDLMVFDNHSCREVRGYLFEAFQNGIIQYLVLSDTNIGKIGAWNHMFGAAQGQYVAFADNDIFFHRGWLSGSLDLFESFPNVGMVTARPLRTPEQFSTSSIEWGYLQGGNVCEEGIFIKWEIFLEHALGTGIAENKAREMYLAGKDFRLNYRNMYAYIGAAHFQFLSRKEVLQRIIPLPSEKPMRGERALDITINQKGYLRLCTPEPYVTHLGNRLPGTYQFAIPSRRHRTFTQKLLQLPGIYHTAMQMYNAIFTLYFENV